MAGSTRDSDSHEDEIRLWREGGGWVTRHVETGATTQGEPRGTALSNLDEAVALHRDEIGREPTSEELLEADIEPDDNATGDQDPPYFMQ